MKDSQQGGPCCLYGTQGDQPHTKSTSSTPAQDPGKTGIVRLFGGVFVGAVAEEMYRTFQVIVQSSRVDLSEAPTSPTAPPASVDGSSSSSSASSDEPPSRTLPSASHLLRGGSSPSEERRQAAGDGEAEARPAAGDGAIAGGKRSRGDGGYGTSFVSECSLPTEKGMFRLRAYRYHGRRSHEPVVMVCGDVRGRDNVPVRVHDQCQTSEVNTYEVRMYVNMGGRGQVFFRYCCVHVTACFFGSLRC